MTRLMLSLGFVCCFATAAHAAPAKGETSAVSSEKVERSVSSLAPIRGTSSFEPSFKEAVALIVKLNHSGSGTDKVDAQDLAVSALNFYVDHKHIDLGSTPEQRKARSRAAAEQAGLLPVLGW